MRVMLDTNILLRLSQPLHQHYSITMAAVSKLAESEVDFCISSQTVYEFLAVATRPAEASGLGMNHATADAAVTVLIKDLTIVYDSLEVMDELRQLVLTHQVIGKSVHDARIVASMLVNQIASVLTINSVDFVRYNEITVLDPRNPV